MANMPWFRFYSEALKDRKIQRACRMAQQPKAVVLGVWTILLCLANDSPERGKLMFSEDMWLTEEEIQAETGLDPIAFGKIIAAFQSLQMITIGAGYEICKWEDRQFTSDNSTGRVQRWRAKKRAEQGGNDTENHVKQDETLQQRFSNAIDPESEIDDEDRARDDYSRVFAAFENWLLGSLTPILEKKLRAAIAESGADTVIEAIGVAKDNRAHSPRYLFVTLDDWKRGRRQRTKSNGADSGKSDLWHSDILPYLRDERAFGDLSKAGQGAVRALGGGSIRGMPTDDLRIRYYSMIKGEKQ